MRNSFLPPPPHIPAAPTHPEVTFTVRGIRLVNREWALRDAYFPITITTSASDPKLSTVEAGIMLQEDAVGLYHHRSRTYVPLKEIYDHSEYLSGDEISLESRNSSCRDLPNLNTIKIPFEEDLKRKRRGNNLPPSSPSATPNGKVIWDVVYRRPGSPQSRRSFDSDSTHSFFEDDDDEEELKKAGKWADLKRCAAMVWDGTYVFLSIKRPLIYLDDLQRGVYCTTWSERGKRKLGGWFKKD
ncbi:hypothetical protein AA313_de0204573 [Arthrobotrys entomopaga]|nr:hypothetical protein AA313_de0204573 [Arthrobotrys entomopaga]